VTLSTTTAGASIRYTTDGSAPSATVGTMYSGPVTVGGTMTIQAMAYASGMTDARVQAVRQSADKRRCAQTGGGEVEGEQYMLNRGHEDSV
jgi:hypothetical protein